MSARLDIIIPVYNEGENIHRVLDALRCNVRTPFRVLLCYDHERDTTLQALKSYPNASQITVVPVRNPSRGPHAAVMAGLRYSDAPARLVYPGDDDYNAGIVDRMYQLAQQGCDIVAASRFMPGGCMKGCRWLKAFLVRSSAFALHHIARVPTHDASNGFRLFSQRVVEQIPVQSTQGFAYSLELLVKCRRLGWRIGEVPAQWHERKAGASRFKVLKWLPGYLRWFFYAFATTYLRRRGVEGWPAGAARV
jgi:glycosyltransferase involved in cell wall biosynthesis